jgi:tRNA pseudouridine38-40 synthase
MERTFFLVIEYDGTRFHGWQRQAGDLTVQETVEEAVFTITRERATLHGSGRTDAGVHALGQCAHFVSGTRLDPGVLVRALNAALPRDVVVRECKVAAPGFHARYDVLSKVYEYRILNRWLPAAIGRDYVWHVRPPLAEDAMETAARALAGTHDFAAFEGAGSRRESTVRTVFSAGFTRRDGLLVFSIEADGFLRYMVRNIVGTLVHAGLGRMPADSVPSILASRDRRRAGPTAPARGLFLREVKYPKGTGVC